MDKFTWDLTQQIADIEIATEDAIIRSRLNELGWHHVPEGYVVVPVEPTENMVSYMETGYLDPDAPTAEDHVKHIYRMMILSLKGVE